MQLIQSFLTISMLQLLGTGLYCLARAALRNRYFVRVASCLTHHGAYMVYFMAADVKVQGEGCLKLFLSIFCEQMIRQVA